MADERTDRGGYDVWEEFAREHDLEGLTLHALAAIQAEGGIAQAPSVAPAVVDNRTQEQVEAAVPVDEHVPQADVTEGLSDEEVAAIVERVTNVHPRLIGYNGATSVIGFAVSNSLRDMLIDAYDHYTDHGCESAARALDRLVDQLIGAFHVARGHTEGDD